MNRSAWVLAAIALVGCADLIGADFSTYQVSQSDTDAGSSGAGGELGAGGASVHDGSSSSSGGSSGTNPSAGGTTMSTGGELGAGGTMTSTGGELGAGGAIAEDAGNPYGTNDGKVCNGVGTNCIPLTSCVQYPTLNVSCCRADHRCGCMQKPYGTCNLF